jgi:Uma2 family endonuclease
MTAVPKILDQRYTVPEYFDLLENLQSKFEYHNGRLVDWRAMAGTTDQHALITVNVATALNNALRDTSCRVYSSDLLLGIAHKAKYRFADVSVICGPILLDPASRTDAKAALNPKVIVEVLSPSSEGDDRGEKFDDYREIESLREYVLVAQHSARVETYRRQDDGVWVFSSFSGLDAVVKLESLKIQVNAADIYRNVEFPPPKTEVVASAVR